MEETRVIEKEVVEDIKQIILKNNFQEGGEVIKKEIEQYLLTKDVDNKHEVKTPFILWESWNYWQKIVWFIKRYLKIGECEVKPKSTTIIDIYFTDHNQEVNTLKFTKIIQKCKIADIQE